MYNSHYPRNLACIIYDAFVNTWIGQRTWPETVSLKLKDFPRS